MNPFSLGWFGQSVFTLILLIPIWLAIPFFSRNYGVRAEIFTVYYFFALAVGGTILLRIFHLVPGVAFYSPLVPLLAVFTLGATLGSLGNLLLFKAVALAPNPVLPIVVSNTTPFIAILAILLGALLPRYFEKGTLSQPQMVGIILAILSVWLLGMRK